MIVSLSPFWSETIPWGEFTLDNFRRIFEEARVTEAIVTSLVVSLVAVAIALPVGFVASSLLLRSRISGWHRTTLDLVVALPLGIPAVVFGAAFLLEYTRGPFILYGSRWVVILVYLVLMLPFTTRMQMSGMVALGESYVEASRVSGASAWRTNWQILVPLMRGTIGAAAALMFVLLTHEFTASLLVRSSTMQTMGTALYDFWSNGFYPEVAAIALVMTGVTLAGVIAAFADRRRRRAEQALMSSVAFGLTAFSTDESADPGQIAAATEAAGFRLLLFPDHTHVPVARRTPYPGGGEMPAHYRRTHDPLVASAWAVSASQHLRVGIGVCLVPARDPIVLAKQVASLDVMSGGRFVLGVGAGWNDEEIADHGVDPARRWAVMRERVLAMRAIWTDDEAEFHGRARVVRAAVVVAQAGAAAGPADHGRRPRRPGDRPGGRVRRRVAGDAVAGPPAAARAHPAAAGAGRGGRASGPGRVLPAVRRGAPGAGRQVGGQRRRAHRPVGAARAARADGRGDRPARRDDRGVRVTAARGRNGAT